jgi:hypothetical protein
MYAPSGEEGMPEGRRREAFRFPVAARDMEMEGAESRAFIRERFGLTDGQVRAIEREGLDRRCPPL